jgi:stearoyl-CoA desaturase (delta-9 desaturase)
LQTLSGQKTIIDWALDHLTHHKFEGTNADAVSINRGFFFAHIGWLMMKRHPDCEEKRSKIDVKYLWSDPIVKFQYDYYIPLVLLINVIIPTFIPYFLFGETVINGFFICFVFRYVYTMELALSGESLLNLQYIEIILMNLNGNERQFNSTYLWI